MVFVKFCPPYQSYSWITHRTQALVREIPSPITRTFSWITYLNLDLMLVKRTHDSFFNIRCPVFPTFGFDRALHPLSGLRLGTEPSLSGASQLRAHGAGSQTPAFTAFRSGKGSRNQSSWSLKTYWKMRGLHFQKSLLSGFPRELVYE